MTISPINTSVLYLFTCNLLSSAVINIIVSLNKRILSGCLSGSWETNIIRTYIACHAIH